MHLSKKNLAIIALVIILAASNVAFAVLYMTKNVSISGGVATVGAIEVYDQDGFTPLAGYGFPLFAPGIYELFTKDFFINNTGNTPVYVYWNISSSSIEWTASLISYSRIENTFEKYAFYIINPDTATIWRHNVYQPEALYIDVGHGQRLQFYLMYTGNVDTPEAFTLVTSFYAQDA